MSEEISKVVDGEARTAETGESLGAMLDSRTRERETWRLYCLIGDTINGNRVLSRGFAERVFQQLEHEPRHVRPRAWRASVALAWIRRASPVHGYRLAAGIAGVAFVAWLVTASQQGPQERLVARAPAMTQPVPERGASPVVSVPEPWSSANEYLLAHQGFSPRNGGFRPVAAEIAAGVKR